MNKSNWVAFNNKALQDALTVMGDAVMVATKAHIIDMAKRGEALVNAVKKAEELRGGKR